MTDRAILSDQTPGQFIRELHCWIATYTDGTEGIIAGSLEGISLLPLMSSRRDVAERLEPMARRAQRAVMHQKHHITSIRLVTFASTDGTRQ